MVETTVIDTWSYILNINENLRSDSSPLRFSLTTETTVLNYQQCGTQGRTNSVSVVRNNLNGELSEHKFSLMLSM